MEEAAEDNRRGRKDKGWNGKWGSEWKGELGLGLGFGSVYSSTKPWRQIGQKGSDSSVTVILSLHTWQKYGLAPPSPAEDMVARRREGKGWRRRISCKMQCLPGFKREQIIGLVCWARIGPDQPVLTQMK